MSGIRCTPQPSGQIVGSAVARAVLAADICGWALAGVEDSDVVVESNADTEWHEVFFVSCAKGKAVVHVPSWKGATLANRAVAAGFASAFGLGPEILGRLVVSRPDGTLAVGEVSEWLNGGQLSGADLQSTAVLEQLGALYGQLHSAGSTWFDASVPALQAEGWLPDGEAGSTFAEWASCTWVLSWLLQQVPEANKTALAAQGVDWNFIVAEIAGLPHSDLLPKTPVVTVHGDSHLGNIIKDSAGSLRLIDFDMTARGPAGSEFGFIVAMLFRCGFAPELVLPIDLQRSFARGYLFTALKAGPETSTSGEHTREDAMLRVMHAWSYVGFLKMGLLCAVLMENAGHEEKRAVMRARGPVLLHRDFLLIAQGCLRRAAAEEAAWDDLLSRGLFFVAEEIWRRSAC